MNSPFLVLKKDCSEAVRWVSSALNQSGLQVVQTFDLHTTRFDQGLCPCPNHGQGQCDCQVVILLVYEHELPPACLIAHGQDGQTWLTLVDSPQQSLHSDLEADLKTALQAALAPQIS